MNLQTATRIVKSVILRTAQFDIYRYDFVQAPQDFYQRLAETSSWNGQWAEARALELFADLSPVQRAIRIVMDDDEASAVLMRSTVVARQWAIQFKKAVASGRWFIEDDPVDHLSKEELIAAFLGDPALVPPLSRNWDGGGLAEAQETIA